MKKKKRETEAIRIQAERTQHREHSVPIFMTSSFVFDEAEEMRAAFASEIERNIYSRFTNPNAKEFIDKLCSLEGTEAGFPTATGMAAVFSTFAALLSSGDHILSCRSIFGSTHSVFTKIFPKWGIETTYADINETGRWGELVKSNTKVLYVETPTNPGIDLIDLEWLGEFAREHDLILIVDNCFATPILQQPAKYGADLVIHSATKFIDGQGRSMGGAVLGKPELIEEVYAFCRATGPAISPFNAWILSKSLETLDVRMERHSKNALRLAKWLEEQEQVSHVKYPFLPTHPQHEIAKRQMKAGGGMLTFELAGGLEAGRKFMDALEMSSMTANLGDTRTIVSHPSSTTHAKLSEEERLAAGITPGMIRVSVGLEHIEDIVEDLQKALV